jgi:hypothetical protein
MIKGVYKMRIVSKLQQRVDRLDQTIHDFEEMRNNAEVKSQLDLISYIDQRQKSLKEKREEYIICIQAIRYLQKHLDTDEFQRVIAICKDAID